MTNWLEEKEKDLEAFKDSCDDCLSSDCEYCSVDIIIEKIKAEIKAYKQCVADIEKKYLVAIEKMGDSAIEHDYIDKNGNRLFHDACFIDMINLYVEAQAMNNKNFEKKE